MGGPRGALHRVGELNSAREGRGYARRGGGSRGNGWSRDNRWAPEMAGICVL